MIILDLPNTPQSQLNAIAAFYAGMHHQALKGNDSGLIWITEFLMRQSALIASNESKEDA